MVVEAAMAEEDGDGDASASTENVIRILLATDNHVGYAERDPIRGNDSAGSFHEIMQLATERDVDMVLLGGDLFHENKPSRKSMFQVMRSLRLNCLGDKPCELQILGDQSMALGDTAVSHVNYEDPDINISIPVFSIHGNHDDPSGEGRLCALDILHVSGLLNYFGRVPENDDITVNPLLLQKGTTKLALYGLSNVRDERLHRSFKSERVKFMRPLELQNEWFNLIVVHQNHSAHTETNYLPENFIQDFFDLVIWGHEHECLIEPKFNPVQNFHVIQPGSSVATSLIAAEAVQKHVAILTIKDRKFSVEKIPLKTVRPFVYGDVILSEEWRLKENKTKALVNSLLVEKVEGYIRQAIADWRDMNPDKEVEEPPLPLIRLNVDYTGGYEVENPQRFSNRFVGKVANPNDVVKFHKKRGTTMKSDVPMDMVDPNILARQIDLEEIKVENLVREFLGAQSLAVLAENGLGDAIFQYVEKDDKDAIEDFVKDSLKSHLDSLAKLNIDEANLDTEIENQKRLMSDKVDKRAKKLENTKQNEAKARDPDFDTDPEEQIQPTRKSTSRKRAVPAKGPSKSESQKVSDLIHSLITFINNMKAFLQWRSFPQ